jgi:hypothetical protein
MMKRKINKYLLLSGIIVTILAVVVPSVAAYEGHAIDVKAHDTIPVTKEVRLATRLEINNYLPSACNSGVYNPAAVTTWNNIPANTSVAWIVNMYVKNSLDYTMYNIKIFDEFNENVKIKVISASTGIGSVTIKDENRMEYWQIGTLEPDGTACLTLFVWTDTYLYCQWVFDPDCQNDCKDNPDYKDGCYGGHDNYIYCDYGYNEYPCTCHQECVWQYKYLAKSDIDGKYYLQSVHEPCESYNPCVHTWSLYTNGNENTFCDYDPGCDDWNDNCRPSGIMMEWDSNNPTTHHSYTGGPYLQITVN